MPVSRLKSQSKSQKRSKRHDTSTPIKTNSRSRSTSTTSKKVEQSRRSQYNIGTDGNSKTRYCKFTAKQRRQWKLLGKDMRHHLYTVVDNSVKMVGSKPVFAGDSDVQELLSQLKHKLKSKLHSVRVPSKKSSTRSDLKTKMIQLQAECDRLILQNSELELMIRQEERRIEALEDTADVSSPTRPELTVEVPDSQLDLPCMPT